MTAALPTAQRARAGRRQPDHQPQARRPPAFSGRVSRPRRRGSPQEECGARTTKRPHEAMTGQASMASAVLSLRPAFRSNLMTMVRSPLARYASTYCWKAGVDHARAGYRPTPPCRGRPLPDRRPRDSRASSSGSRRRSRSARSRSPTSYSLGWEASAAVSGRRGKRSPTSASANGKAAISGAVAKSATRHVEVAAIAASGRGSAAAGRQRRR